MPPLTDMAGASSLGCQQPQVDVVCPGWGNGPQLLPAWGCGGRTWLDPPDCPVEHSLGGRAGSSGVPVHLDRGCICLQRGLSVSRRAATSSGPGAVLLFMC